MPRYYIGTSGWMYSHWRERFYPSGLAKARWFDYFAERVPTVEVNASFYRLPPETTFRSWGERAPAGFRYALKVSRFITHLKKLRDCADPIATFVERARLLGEHLGPLLYQLPPSLQRNDGLLQAFLRLLPPDLTHVFEFRHASWFDPEVYSLLDRHDAVFCVHDFDRLRPPMVRTGRACYVRFHGPSGHYAGSYSDQALADWAARIREAVSSAEAAYAYFNNDDAAHAIANAMTLRSLLA